MDQSLLEYKGQLSSEVRVQLLDLIQCIALYNLGQRPDLKKLVGVALELLDNAQRYNASNDVDFSWRIDGSQLVVTIRNKASRKDAERLVESVKAIGEMTTDEITLAFKEQLMSEGFGEKGGAGLGMLQIARKVGKNIKAAVEETQPDQFMCTSEVSADLERINKRA